MLGCSHSGISAIHGEVLELRCNHDALICPLQNVTCLCLVTGSRSGLAWKMQSQIVAQFSSSGKVVQPPADSAIEAKAQDQGNGVSSNLSFIAQSQDETMAVECSDDGVNSISSSYTVVGGFVL